MILHLWDQLWGFTTTSYNWILGALMRFVIYCSKCKRLLPSPPPSHRTPRTLFPPSLPWKLGQKSYSVWNSNDGSTFKNLFFSPSKILPTGLAWCKCFHRQLGVWCLPRGCLSKVAWQYLILWVLYLPRIYSFNIRSFKGNLQIDSCYIFK